MATILEHLKGINAYPVPLRAIQQIADRLGLDMSGEATAETLNGKPYNLAVAGLLLWLSYAPNVTQGGQSYSFTDEQRKQFRNRAAQLYEEFGEEDAIGAPKTVYGYKGSRL